MPVFKQSTSDGEPQSLRSNSGILPMLAAIRRASSRVSRAQGSGGESSRPFAPTAPILFRLPLLSRRRRVLARTGSAFLCMKTAISLSVASFVGNKRDLGLTSSKTDMIMIVLSLFIQKEPMFWARANKRRC